MKTASNHWQGDSAAACGANVVSGDGSYRAKTQNWRLKNDFWGHFCLENVRTRSATTRDRNLQFRGAVSTGGSPLDFLLFLQYLCAI